MKPAVRAAWPSRGIAIASLIALVALTVAVAARVVFPFDAPVLALARTLDGWPPLWQAVSQSANIPLIAIAVVFVVWLIRIKRYREAVLVVMLLAAVTGGSEAVKQLTGRPRPSGSGDGIPGVIYSYPSGHVLEVTTILGMMVVRFWRSAKPLTARLAFAAIVGLEIGLVAIARMALNEHYPTDLLAGLLGAIAAVGWYAWFTRAGGWADVPAAAQASGPAERTPVSPEDHRPRREVAA